jgi:hypothetical protein
MIVASWTKRIGGLWSHNLSLQTFHPVNAQVSVTKFWDHLCASGPFAFARSNH